MMTKSVNLVPGQHIHFVGIGGIGLSAIARVLHQQGYFITGSDHRRSAITDMLIDEGLTVYIGHRPSNIRGAEMLIVTSAVDARNPEIRAATHAGIPVYKRKDIIADIMEGRTGIAIAGTHGKTTTTAMTTHILRETAQRPCYIIGGILRNSGKNSGMDTGDAFVIEADEYDNMYHGLRPHIEVITNIEYDHPDFFKSPHDMVQSFRRFVGLLPDDGLLIVCADDPTAQIFANNRRIVDLPVATYGIDNPEADWHIHDLQYDAQGNMIFRVNYHANELGIVQLQQPGQHNALNALAALVVANSQGVPFEHAAAALQTFQGTGRRLDIRGSVDDVVVIDDYAHHPTAIEATLHTLRQRYPDATLWAVWQPHTYTRTQALAERYLDAFEDAHHVLVTDIYAAREDPLPGVTSAALVADIRHPDVQHTPTLRDATQTLLNRVEPRSVIVIMSAGDAPLIGVNYLRARRQQSQGNRGA